MRALVRRVTGSPASVKGKAKQGKEHSNISTGDIASSWSNIKNVCQCVMVRLACTSLTDVPHLGPSGDRCV